MKRWNLVAVTVGAAVLAACGGSGGSGYSTGPANTNPGGTAPGGGTNPNSNEVTMQDQSFSPGTVTITKGTTVTWKWPSCDATGGYGSGGCVSHSVIFDDGSNISSPEQSQGTFSRAFPTAGTFKYHCGVHGQSMNGQVIVQ